MISDKLQELISAAYKTSEENYSVFVGYHPHVELVNVNIHSKGWNANDEYDINSDIYLDHVNAIQKLDDIIKVINMGYHDAARLMEFGEVE
jgi:hypothetical protein